jgi:hypothetical protein
MVTVSLIGLLIIFVIHYILVSLVAGELTNPLIITIKLLNTRIFQRGYDLFENAAVFTNIFYANTVGIAGIPKLAALFGINVRNINNELFLALVPNAKVYTGSYNGPWYLYDFAYFSLPGVLLGSVVLGIIIGLFNKYFKKIKKDRIACSLVGFMIICMLGIFDKPLSTWLFSQGAILAVITIFLLNKMKELRF